ncbi:MAG: hypothetical protein ACR2F1_01100 [Nitrososphaeraceae archaeon]
MNNKLLPINSDDNEDKTNKAKIYNYKSKEIVNKEKIKNLKIHIDEVNKISKKKNIIHKKIQLWTNDKGNEYAICLLFDSDVKIDNAQFIASTNPNEKYIHPIAETDNIKDLQHGWDYTLREVIDNYKKNYYRKISGEDIQSIKLIPFYKCTYCNKELSSEDEKKDHEFLWHI